MIRNYIILISLLFLASCKQNKNVKEDKNINPFFELAHEYRDTDQYQKSFVLFNKAKDSFLQQKDSLGVGKCLVNMAYISTNNGDYFGGQEISLSAISYFNEADTNQLIYIKYNLNNLGISNYNLKEYDQAISFYKQSLKYLSDSASLVVKNNIANCFREKKDFKSSLELYQYILNQKVTDSIEYARVLTNFSITKWLQDTSYNAAPNLLKALRIRERESDLEDVSSSYAHLSDYYYSKDPNLALSYARKMYEKTKNISNAEDRLLALKKLVKLSPEKEAKKYFESYQKLDDSVSIARGNAKNQFALVRYKTEKHKADFLKAQADNLAKQKNILIQNIGIGVLIVVIVFVFFWYRRRKKIMKQEKEIEVKNTALTYSKKVHDRVANKVYHVMTEVEYSPIINKESILQKLDVLYNISRDISHDKTDLEENKSFSRQLSELLISYQSEEREIIIYGNHDEIWINISEEVRNEVFNILRELMTNMKKHSRSSEVIIQFQQLSQHINIIYTDNGIGIQRNTQFGNGIKNTETRIKNIMGTITFETHENKGLEILIYFPIN
jgi:two-component sensor histidine kinase